MEVLRLGVALGFIYVQCFNDNIKGKIILFGWVDGYCFCGEIGLVGWRGGWRNGNFRLNRHRGSLHSRPFLHREVMMKAAQLLLVHGAKYSGNRPQIIHPNRIGFIQQIQHKGRPIDGIIRRFAGFKGHRFRSPIELVLQMLGNSGVPLAAAQPLADLLFLLFVQQSALSGKRVPQVAAIIQGANAGIGEEICDGQISFVPG